VAPTTTGATTTSATTTATTAIATAATAATGAASARTTRGIAATACLPPYRTRHYVVDDWRGHHLYAPPQGYQWVQSGGDYLLVAVATGIIASILLSQ
jgi:hypothetical protein